jgi:mycothiol synthase
MIELRVAETDADLEAWRQVRIAVLPNERTAQVDELRRLAYPGRLMLLATLDGEPAGSGISGRSQTGGAFTQPRVLPDRRRRGVGAELLRSLASHAVAEGYESAGAHAESAGALEFGQRFGFAETSRQLEQVRAVGSDEPPPEVPEGLEFVSLAERPDLFLRSYHELAVEALADMPTASPLQVSADDWEREWVSWPEGSFIALAGEEIVGCAGLIRDGDREDRAEHSLTAVRRDWRGRGVAKALKQQVIAWASGGGLSELYTWTQTGNEAMQAVNRSLGFVDRDVTISLRAPLPLPERKP